MKKTILFLCIIFSMSAFGQNKEVQKDIKEVTFYGVDFSKAKVYGASESPYDFKAAFCSINQLFVKEAKKYNVGKAFKKDVTINVKEVCERASKVPADDLFIYTNKNKISEAELQALINNFSTNEKEGTGLIFVAELLDKSEPRGYYHIVFFDIKTKKIVDTWEAVAKARGFGLRNFWARSVHQVINNVRM